MSLFNVEVMKAEFKNIWSSWLLEISIFIPLFSCLIYNPHLFGIFPYEDVGIAIQEMITARTISVFHSALTFMIVICSAVSAISFARDYEKGLLQTLFSLPLSRTEIFLSKMLSIVLVSSIIVSISLTITLILDFYFAVSYLLKPILIGFLMAFAPLFFYFSLSAFIALIIRKTVASTVISIVLSYMLQALPPALSDINYYMPDKIPIFMLCKLLGYRSTPSFHSGYGLPSTLLANAPSIELLLILLVIYSIGMMTVTYTYFIKKMELAE